jgi:lipid II:glycine glycyltransferase (peptidoglycan interpeptide bridge formation enzyme)
MLRNYLPESRLSHTPTAWDTFITTHNGHLLQTWAWGQLKAHFGWIPHRLQVDNTAAQILFKRLPLGLTIAYIPKGPVVDWNNPQQCQTLLAAIHAEAKKRRAIFLKIEPDIERSSIQVLEFLNQMGFTASDTIQPQTSLIIDIRNDENAILAAMKQKNRYNIRLAIKKGVAVRQGNASDVEIFHNLALTTSDRDRFDVHNLAYYQICFDLFAPDRCALFIAEFEGEPIAALMAFCQNENAYYFFGASANQYRNLMPSYLVQWFAIQWAKEQGCTRYDLWGIPNANLATLEAEFQNRSDGLWGVYRFKRGFGGRYVQNIGAFDYVYNPLLYKLYKMCRGV